MIDTLPDETLDDLVYYLAELNEVDEPLSAEMLAGIEEGLRDVREGRTVSLEGVQAESRFVKFRTELSRRAERDLDHLDKPTLRRVLLRLDQLKNDLYDSRLSAPVVGTGGLRKSRIGAWRLIFQVSDEKRIIVVVMIERRGQVYKRI